MNNFHYTLEACRSKNRPSCIININVSRETLSDIFCDIFHYFLKSFQFLNSFQNMIVSRETLFVTSPVDLQYSYEKIQFCSFVLKINISLKHYSVYSSAFSLILGDFRFYKRRENQYTDLHSDGYNFQLR